jgi:glycerol-3-phosphate O-acyltransferase
LATDVSSASLPDLIHRARLLWLGLLRRVLNSWVRSNILPENLDDLEIDPKRPVFYVLDTNALSSLLIVDQVCLDLEWPRPTRRLRCQGIDLPRSHGANRRYRGLFIRRPDKRRHSAMLRRLIQQSAASGQTSCQIVPVTVLIGRAPHNEDSLFKVLFSENWDIGGRLRRFLSTLINGRATMVQFGRPIDVGDLLDETEHGEQALGRASRILRVQFKRIRTSAIGPDRSHRRTLVEKVVKSDSVQHAVAAKAKRDSITPEKAEEQARAYAREIAADYSYSFIRIADMMLNWFWNRIYRGVRVNHFSRFREAADGHEVVYVPCHRSHIDYLLLSWILYHRGFVPPHIAAGLNLNMPLVGPLLRRGGAFFLRRSFRSQPLYASVFNQYVSMILSRGVALEYFIEGTRSRTGRLLPPRAGMLSITVRAFLHDQTRPVLFQPVYIGYERLAEGSSYIHELSGHQKKPESLSDFKNLINILRKNYGEVAVSFGEPVRLNDLLDEHHRGWREETLKADSKPPWLSGMVNDLADRIMVNINRAAHVNPINLLATALLASRKHALDEDDLERVIELLIEILRATAPGDRVQVTELTPGQIIDYGLELGVIERHEHRLGSIIRTDAKNAVLLTYFRNNMAHLLAMSAWIASCFLNFRSVRRKRIGNLTRTVYPYIKRELFLPWDRDELEPVIESCLDALVKLDLLKPSGESLQRASGGSDQAYYLRLLGTSLMQTFERYFITVSVLAKNGSGTLTRPQLEKLCILCAQRISLLHEFEAPEFSDRTLFKQFIDSLSEAGLLGKDDDGRLTYTNVLEQLARDAKLILSKEIRHTIIQIAPDALELEED